MLIWVTEGPNKEPFKVNGKPITTEKLGDVLHDLGLEATGDPNEKFGGGHMYILTPSGKASRQVIRRAGSRGKNSSFEIIDFQGLAKHLSQKQLFDLRKKLGGDLSPINHSLIYKYGDLMKMAKEFFQTDDIEAFELVQLIAGALVSENSEFKQQGWSLPLIEVGALGLLLRQMTGFLKSLKITNGKVDVEMFFRQVDPRTRSGFAKAARKRGVFISNSRKYIEQLGVNEFVYLGYSYLIHEIVWHALGEVRNEDVPIVTIENMQEAIDKFNFIFILFEWVTFEINSN